MPKLVPDTLRYCKEVSAATNLSASCSAWWIGKLLALLYIHAIESLKLLLGREGGGGGGGCQFQTTVMVVIMSTLSGLLETSAPISDS